MIKCQILSFINIIKWSKKAKQIIRCDSLKIDTCFFIKSQWSNWNHIMQVIIKCNRFIKTERVLRIWCDHPETLRALITCFSSIHPAASSRRNYLTSQEKACEKPIRLTSKRLNYSDTSSWTRKKRMWVEVLGNTSRTKCLSSSPAARGKFLSMWKPSDTYDLLRTHSYWTSGDTYIPRDCITARRRRDRHADRIWTVGFGE